MNIETDSARVARLQNAANRIGDTDSGEDVLGGLYAAGRLRDIQEDPTTWMSRSRATEGKIWWGTGAEGPQGLHDRYYGQITEEFAKTHRLLHEMGHLAMIQPNTLVVGEAFDFYETLDKIRARNAHKLGLSALASIYGQERKPHEDAAELFGMLTHDENRYRAYMQFVQNESPGAVRLKANHGIATVSASDAHLLDYQLRTVHEQTLL